MKQKLTSPGVARFTKALLDILFYAGIAVTVSLPWTMRWAARFYPSFAARLTLHTALFLLAGVCAVLILFELRRMLKTVVSGDCFVHQNVSSLCRMAYYALSVPSEPNRHLRVQHISTSAAAGENKAVPEFRKALS